MMEEMQDQNLFFEIYLKVMSLSEVRILDLYRTSLAVMQY